jgi:glycosyltransferase involved in cell wall biosynthesis
VATTRYGRSRLIGRALDYLSFYWSMRRMLAALAQANDIVVAKTDPPLLSLPAMHAARRRSAHLVNWLQDIYPEVAVALGMPLLKGPLGWMLTRLRNRSLTFAAANVVLGQAMAARVQAYGVAPGRIHVIHNASDDEAIVPIAAADNPLRRDWGLQDKFVVGYSGNLGRAHEFETMLAAADRLRQDPRIVFLFIGGGRQVDELAKRVRAQRLEASVRFMPYQDRAALKYSLTVPDVHWLSLRPPLEGLLFPSKLYGIAAAGRPVIAITRGDGEIAKLVADHRCGLAFEPGDAEGLARALTLLAHEPERCAEMGRRARAMLEQEFSRRKAFAQWRALLAEIGGEAPTS